MGWMCCGGWEDGWIYMYVPDSERGDGNAFSHCSETFTRDREIKAMASYRTPSYEGLQVLEHYGFELAVLPTPTARPIDLRVRFADQVCTQSRDERKKIRGVLDGLVAYHADVLMERRMRREKVLLWGLVVVIWVVVAFGGVYGGVVVRRRSGGGNRSEKFT
jgi:hypothetical protein